MGALSPLTAARYICEGRDWSISNLELQKMLYLGQMLYLGEHQERLIGGAFEAWDYGPVLPSVYREAKAYGSRPIRFLAGASKIVDKDRRGVLDQVIDQLSNMSAGQLVSITHWKEGAWAKNYVPGVKGVMIPDRDIVEEYNRRLKHQHP